MTGVSMAEPAYLVHIDQGHDYWSRTREPLACLVFLTPLLVIYEIGVFWLTSSQPDALRNGADLWMRAGLETIGLNHPLVPPLIIVVGLLGWHLLGGYYWRILPDTLAGMLAESILYAFILLVVGQATDVVFQRMGAAPVMAITREHAARSVSFIGAGIYEEVMFRLCLLPACYGLFRAGRLGKSRAAALAIVTTSLAFSLAHYIGPGADQLQLFTFTFRALAGGFFAILFCTRGFGVTVGCHALYDLLVGVLMTR
jgi:hypothetical protein